MLSLLVNFVSADCRNTIWSPHETVFIWYSFPVSLGQIYFVLDLISTNHNVRNGYPEMLMAQAGGWEELRIERAEKLIQIANENGWKHEVYIREYLTDVTEVCDPRSTDGNLLLEFLTHTVNLPKTADKQLVEEMLDFVKDLTIFKDGKRFGEKKNSLVVIYKK